MTRPIERKLLADVAAKGGWERILDRIASGETISKLSREFLRPDGVPITRSFFSTVLHKDRKRHELVTVAQKQAAMAHAEAALERAQTVDATRDDVAKAKLEIDQRNFLAKVLDRETFAVDRPQITQQITVGTVHLDILRSRTGELPKLVDALPELPALPAQIEEVSNG